MTRNHNNRPLRIGLTGGIASGKSTVADMFAVLGVPIIDTDVIAREIVQPGEPALDEIRAQFGDSVFDENGELDRNVLRRIVFSDEAARYALEALLHPRIGAETKRQADAAGGDYQVIVVPLLVNSPLLGFVDRILVVDCEETTQIERLLDRDAESVAQAQRILAAQASREERLAIATDVIDNDQGLARTRQRVAELDTLYRSICATPPGGAK